MPRFPRTSKFAEGLSDRVFSRLAARAKERGGKIYPLHVGDTWMEPYEGARAEAQLTADTPRLHNYAAVQGEPPLLDAIVDHLARRGGALVDRECVQVVSGATAGLSVIAEALLEPGDEVLLPAPFWPLIRGIVNKRGARAIEIPFFDLVENQAGFDAEAALEARVNERTAAIYVNTPHNPTGGVLPDPILAAIARVAERHDLWILSDEVYEELYFGARPIPVWARADFQARTIAVHSLSKGYGLAGARVGWAHGPHDAMQTIRGVQTFATYCAARPMQLGAARALREGGAWLEAARRAYEDAAQRTARALGIKKPDGGTFAFIDARPCLREGEDVVGLLERCLEAGVLLTPGSASGSDYASWVRVCFTSVPPDELSEALERIAPILKR